MSTPDYDVLPVQLWQQPVQDPWRLLKAFYNYIDTADALRLMEGVVAAALSEDYVPADTSPANTCFFMERLESMVYAAHLLQQPSKVTTRPVRRLPAVQQAAAGWYGKPLPLRHLSPAEQQEPMAVVNAFFRFSTWPQWQVHLYEWRHCALGSQSIAETAGVSSLLAQCEQLYRLTEALHLLYRDHCSPARAALPAATRQLLESMVALLQPEKVFALQAAGGEHTSLLFVLPDTDAQPYKQYDELLHLAVIRHPYCSLSLHKASTIRHRLEKGHPFYSRACTLPHLVYDDGSGPLPATSAAVLAALDAQARLAFYTEFPKAQDFLHTARAALQGKEYEHALFMLHQAAELSLRAAILAITGQELKTHQLAGLLRYAGRFAPALLQVFPPANEAAQTQLQLLDRAYNEARYNAEFTVGAGEARAILKRVVKLQGLVEGVFG